jgi:hypothetical protein
VAVTTASQYTICVCLLYLRSQFGSGSAAWAFGRLSTVLCFAQLRDAMPTTWFFIKGCPFPDECNALKTGPGTKMLKWHGRTEQEAVDKCAHHLIHSRLHNMMKRDAVEAAWNVVQSYEDDTDEEVAEGAPATPPRVPIGANPKRPRTAIADDDGDNADADDPLVTELAMQVERQVERLVERREQSSSSTVLVREHRSVLLEAKQSIADAEAACRKAQGFAQSAAKAFGEVASKLNRARLTLD